MGLDRLFQTKPWLLVAGSSLGVLGGFAGFVLVVIRMNR